MSPDDPPSHSALRRALAWAALGLVAFGAIACYWTLHPGLPPIDAAARQWADAWTTPPIRAAMQIVTALGSIPLTVALVLGLAGWWARRGRRRSAWMLVGALAAAEATVYGLKLAFNRMRPSAPGMLMREFSFPSGHAFHAAFAYGLLLIALCPHLDRRWARWTLGGVALGLVLLVGGSRILLEVHYATDVLGGIALGGAWLALTRAALIRYAPRPLSSTTRRRH